MVPGLAGTTYASRFYIAGNVAVTALYCFTLTNSGVTENVGLYSDNGAGTAPVSLLTSGFFVDNQACACAVTLNVPDVQVTTGFYWAATTSAAGTPRFWAGLGYFSQGVYFSGNLPATVGATTPVASYPAIGAYWVCP